MKTRFSVTLSVAALAWGLAACNKEQATPPTPDKPAHAPMPGNDAPTPTPAAPAAPAVGAPAAAAPAGDKWTTTASGLKHQVMKKGTGTASPSATSTVKVHYHGTFQDGKVFDSSVDRGEPISFPLNQVIKGWTEGLQLMKVGDKFKFEIPPDLAYGAGGRPGIPPNSTLVFEVELLGIQ